MRSRTEFNGSTCPVLETPQAAYISDMDTPRFAFELYRWFRESIGVEDILYFESEQKTGQERKAGKLERERLEF